MFNLPFLASKPPFVEHEVQGHQMRFYRCSVRTISLLRTAAAPVLKAFSALFADTKHDTSTESVTTTGKDGETQNRVAIAASTADVLRMRGEQRSKSIQDLVEGVSSDEALTIMVELITNSLKDNFPKPLTDSEKKEFLKSVDVETMMEMLTGVAKAHEKIFAPFKKRVEEAAGTLKNVMAAKLNGMVEETAASPTPTPDSGET